jgi:hypothetical protein
MKGVKKGHGYTILKTLTIQHEGKKLHILKIRNPHGSGEWTGDWSDKSSKWTP